MQYNIIDTKNPDFFSGKKVVLRVGINAPISEGKIEDAFRLEAILPIMEFLSKSGSQVTLLGHIGRKKEENLDIIFDWFEKKLSQKKIDIFYDKRTFAALEEKKILQKTTSKIEKLHNGQILLLDNIRATEWEKENNTELAMALGQIFSVYINEAFSVSHRKHMSMDKLPAQFFEKNRFAGLQFQKEMEAVKKIQNPTGKSIFILGGAKTATKIPMLEKMLEKFDKIIIGGAVANQFYKQMGYEIGESKVDVDFTFDTKFFKELLKSKKVFLPKKVITENGTKNANELSADDKIMDISPQSFADIETDLKEAEFVFFNGPMGYYEGGYNKGTKYLLKILANKNNFFVAGGGNTASAIFELGLENNVDFISTGGGALIQKISE